MPETQKSPSGAPIITPELAAQANREIVSRLDKRVEEKGRKGFVNAYETYGKLCEELLEFQMSIWKRDDEAEKISELEDIAVGCIWGIASQSCGWQTIMPQTMYEAKGRILSAIKARAEQLQPTGHYSEHESSGVLSAAIHDFGQKVLSIESTMLLELIAEEAVWAIASYHGGMKQKKKK